MRTIRRSLLTALVALVLMVGVGTLSLAVPSTQAHAMSIGGGESSHILPSVQAQKGTPSTKGVPFIGVVTTVKNWLLAFVIPVAFIFAVLGVIQLYHDDRRGWRKIAVPLVIVLFVAALPQLLTALYIFGRSVNIKF